MAGQQADGRTDEQESIGKTVKRRGILAAAGAVVAGIVTKQTSQPVQAAVLPVQYSSDLVNFPQAFTMTPVFVTTANGFGGAGFNAVFVGQSSISGVDGVRGTNTITGTGVHGDCNGAGGIGVRGESVGGTGVYGQTSASNQYGVLGTTYAANSTAVAGTCTADGSSAFSGGTTNPLAYGAFFQGHVVVAGSFDVSPLGNKHGVAPHPDGSHRTFYSVESPECWVEDFGTGTLAGGKAEVALDADFAALTHTDDYHVFITGVDEHHHLIAKGKTAKGFVVEADTALATLKGKKAVDLAGTFSYRVVARPRTTAAVGRLAKATLPNLPLPVPPPPQKESPKKA